MGPLGPQHTGCSGLDSRGPEAMPREPLARPWQPGQVSTASPLICCLQAPPKDPQLQAASKLSASVLQRCQLREARRCRSSGSPQPSPLLDSPGHARVLLYSSRLPRGGGGAPHGVTVTSHTPWGSLGKSWGWCLPLAMARPWGEGQRHFIGAGAAVL